MIPWPTKYSANFWWASHLWASDRTQTSAEFNTKSEDIVLDTFAGSGTTIMACEQNGRFAYCMELDPKYIDVVIDRWEKFTGEKAVKIS